ncbi:MAG: hypothetical protein R3C15_16680 [Thermoleophilia bacterium]
MHLGVDSPLSMGQVIATTVRLYGRRPVTYVAIGALSSAPQLLISVAPLAVTIVVVALAFVAALAVTAALAEGEPLATLPRRLLPVAPVVAALALAVGVPYALPNWFAIFALIQVIWLSLVGTSVPAAVLDDREGPVLVRVVNALRRSSAYSVNGLLHALAVVFALLVITGLFTAMVGVALNSFGDQTATAAFFVARSVMVPLLYLGLAVLYADQCARHHEPGTAPSARAFP